MASNTAIVDDRDPLIQYAGAWSQSGVSEEFDSTTSFSVATGASATFSFVGTSVTVYGSIGPHNATQATWSFAVDGAAAGTYTPPANMTSPIHHQALWTTPASSLANGTHSLVITQTGTDSVGVIFLDYIMWTTTSLDVPTFFIDDRDPQVTYTPAWRQFGSDPDFDHTSQASTSVGDFYTLPFQGRGIKIYGGMTSMTENASIVLDGGLPTFWVPPATATQTNNFMYDSGSIPPGNHTLVVTATSDQSVWADYWLVTPNPVGFVETSSSSVSSSAPTSSGSSQTQTSHKKSTPIGAIVGPVVGVLVLAALVAVIFFWRRRRHRYEAPDDAPMSDVLNSRHSGFNSASLINSGHNVSGAAGPPPVLAHGYSSELGPFATPHHTPFIEEVNRGVSAHEPDSYFAAGTGSPEPASTSRYQAGASISGSSRHQATPSTSGSGHNPATPSISGSSQHPPSTTSGSGEAYGGIANATGPPVYGYLTEQQTLAGSRALAAIACCFSLQLRERHLFTA
ncbi:hypothetical protein MSAN_02039800 [Mycena sanguinolenta]|uniref:Transmembrane protein n=1 Tax=Mycena sanguinolenta TaxID=230812 RepID=A0A8H6XIH5_9AGAR|nr:hypothetical protein MSAN_02039800 [Mycena sanguinolenta]